MTEISLTIDKSILSYADSESATLSATVLNGSSQALEGVTVEFFKGSTSLGTATTNASGVATKRYASVGSGYVSFTASVSNLVRDHDIELSLQDPITADETTVLEAVLTPDTSDGKVHYLVNGLEIGEETSPFSFPHVFNEEGAYTVQAVYTGDEDDNIAISEPVTVIVKAPEPRPGSSASQTTVEGTYDLEIISAPSKFTYLDGGEVIVQLRKGQTPMPRRLIEVQKVNGMTASVYTDSQGKYAIKNNQADYLPGNRQWGARFYDETDEDMDRKFLCKALRWIEIEKARPTFTHNDVDGKVSKGKYLTVKLSGVEGGLKNKKITYTLNGGSKKSKTTNSGGKIAIPFKTKGTFKVKVMFAGDTKYKAVSKTFTIKVV